jgi:hypothetical protein
MLAHPAWAEVTGEVLEYGYYQAVKAAQRVRNNELPSGYERTGGEVRLVQQTDRIPLAKDRLFGFRFHIKGFNKDQVTAQLKLVVSHPEMTRPDGSKSTGYSYPMTLVVRNGQVDDKTGYQLNKEFEMVEGDWRFEYWLGERKLLEKTFKVVSTGQQPAAEASPSQPSNTVQPQPPPEKNNTANKNVTKNVTEKKVTAVMSDKLSPEFKQQVNAMIRKYQATKADSTDSLPADNGPVSETQTGAATQALRQPAAKTSKSPPATQTQELAQQSGSAAQQE